MVLSTVDLIRLTWSSLSGNPLRSFLTCLGVFMGVAAVNATLQVGNISRAQIAQELAKREAPQVQLFLWSVRAREPDFDDLEFLRQRLQGFQAISGLNPVWQLPPETVYQGQEAEPRILAVSLEFLETSGRNMISGRFFSSSDLENYRNVVLIDQVLADKLFLTEDPIGKLIFTGGRPFFVIGIIESKQPDEGEEPAGQIMMSLATYSALTGSRRINQITVRPRDFRQTLVIQKQAQELLKQRFSEPDIGAYSDIEKLVQQAETLELASRGLTVVGLIALLVGGVGIANISIAMVMERTQEIGLRLAIGATKRDILWQFILEAVLLSLMGGTIAIASVHLLTSAIAQRFELPYQFDLNITVVSLGSAILVGVGAGFFPALRASQLDPVKALRSS